MLYLCLCYVQCGIYIYSLIYHDICYVTQLYRKPTAAPIDRDYPQATAVRVGSSGRAPARGPTQEELEEEKEEPDRLTLLLPQSRFDCVNKQTGYYADEDLNCEVFHYCQDNAKHSWICPEGFTFHQVSNAKYL